MDLISGLPDDLARECLIRIPFQSLRSISSVCKAWNSEIRSPDFHRRRKSSGQTRPVFVLPKIHLQAYSHDKRLEDCTIPLFYRLMVFDPESESWTRLPLGPGLPVEFSALCGVVGVGSKVIVISAGWDQSSGLINMVHVFDFLTGQWCRGANVPGPGRLRFGLCGEPVHHRVLLAGGFGIGGYFNEKRSMWSTLLYDVANDTWTQLADIKREIDDCIVVFHGDRFHVMSRFSFPSRVTFAESLDLDTLEWVPIDDMFLEDSTRERSRLVTGNGNGDLYYMGQNVALRRGGDDKWEVVTETPDELRVRKCVMTWQDKLVVIGGKEVNWPNKAYVLDLKSREWTKKDVPDEYLSDGIVLGCAMEL